MSFWLGSGGSYSSSFWTPQGTIFVQLPEQMIIHTVSYNPNQWVWLREWKPVRCSICQRWPKQWQAQLCWPSKQVDFLQARPDLCSHTLWRYLVWSVCLCFKDKMVMKVPLWLLSFQNLSVICAWRRVIECQRYQNSFLVGILLGVSKAGCDICINPTFSLLYKVACSKRTNPLHSG